MLGNWQKELERFSPDLSVHLHYGSNRLKAEDFTKKAEAVDVVLTSYGLTHLDLEEFESLDWSSVSIDEAQNIKNSATKQSRAVRKLKGSSSYFPDWDADGKSFELNYGRFLILSTMAISEVSVSFKSGLFFRLNGTNEKNRIHQLQALIRPFLLEARKRMKMWP